MINQPISGMQYFIRGFYYLKKSGIKRFVVIPLLINIIILAALLTFSGHYFNHFIHWVDHSVPAWLQWLNWILWPLFVIAISVMGIYFFTIMSNIIGAPFNSFLSEKVEKLERGVGPGENSGVIDAIKDFPRVMLREWLKIRYFIPRFIIMLILFLIPGVNAIASILWFLFCSWSVAMQYVDYPMDNHHISFIEMKRYMRVNWLQNISFGATVTIAMLIPILNLFVMPAAVIGATLMWLDNQQKSSSVITK